MCRYSRDPSSLDSLVALLRKLELHPAVRNWTPGRLAAAIIHSYRFDGVMYDRCVDTSSGAEPIRIDMQVEYPKMALITQLISGASDTIPEDAISQREKVRFEDTEADQLLKTDISHHFSVLFIGCCPMQSTRRSEPTSSSGSSTTRTATPGPATTQVADTKQAPTITTIGHSIHPMAPNQPLIVNRTTPML